MQRRRQLGRGVAVVGAGISKFGMFKDRDSKDLFAEAFNAMIASVDKGMDPRDIDCMYLGNFSNDFFTHQAHWAPIIADQIGLVPKPATRTEGACASSALAFREGVFAIASGFYDIVLVSGVEDMSKLTTEEVSEGLTLAAIPYEAKAGFTFPGVYGALATIYFDKYGASRDHLMNVTIKSHNNARMNPKAQFRASIKDIMDSRKERAKQKNLPIPNWENEKDFLRDASVNPVIAWPLHLFDCCPISDGASCMLLVGEELAKNFTDVPLYVRGIGQGSGRGLHAAEELLSFEASKYAAQEAYAMSGLTPDDIQFAEVHDCFSMAEIIHLEDLGFVKPGKGFKAVEEGMTALNGPKPINTSEALNARAIPWVQPGSRSYTSFGNN